MKRSLYVPGQMGLPQESYYVPAKQQGNRPPSPQPPKQRPPGPKTKAIFEREFGPQQVRLLQGGQGQRQPCQCRCHCPYCPTHGIRRFPGHHPADAYHGGPGPVTVAIEKDWAIALPPSEQKEKNPAPRQENPKVNKKDNDDSSSSEEIEGPVKK